MGKNAHNLDILRSVAVLFVLFDHTIKFLGFERNAVFNINWLGRLGVTFFFVHTAFVLMLSLKRSNLGGWRLPINFYVRRLFRLFPLSCLLILFTWMTGIPQSSIHPHIIYGAKITPIVLLSNLTLTQNFYGFVDILGQLWSLPIELDMYFLLPLLYVFARKWPRVFTWTSWPLAVLFGLYLIHIPGFWRIGFLGYAPCFVPGVIAYVLSRRLNPTLGAWWWPVYLLAMATAFMIRPSWQFAWIVALCLGAAIPIFKDQTSNFVNIAASTIAKYSYGIYLAHTLCIWAAFSALHEFQWYMQGLTFLALICAIPWLLFVGVEQPAINLGKGIAQRLTFRSVSVSHEVTSA
jgi:peptidoglycan/LPS O-acetylase OafA/YrhL